MKHSAAPARTITLALVGGMSAGVLGLYGLDSEQRIARGFSDRGQVADVWGASVREPGVLKSVVADEAYWLRAGRRDVTPAVVQGSHKLSFGPLDVMSVTPLPPGLGITGDSQQPMVLVTAEETTAQGTRVVRFIVEAVHAPAAQATVGKGL